MIKLNHITAGNKSKPALVFLHGFLGAATDWQHVITNFTNDYYCIAFDLPGHGKSLISDSSPHPNLKNISPAIYTALNNLDIHRAVLIGYSMGGRIGLHLLKADMAFWNGAILESVSPGIEDPIQKTVRLQQDMEIAAQLETIDFAQFLQKWYNQPLFAGFRKLPLFDQILSRRLQNDPGQVALALRAFSVGHQDSFWQFLGQITMPMMMVCGSRDEKYRAITDRAARLNQVIRPEIVPGSGHVIHSERPDEFRGLVSGFLNGISP